VSVISNSEEFFLQVTFIRRFAYEMAYEN
jgi:hypothetical protein